MLSVLFMSFSWLPPFLQIIVRVVLSVAVLVITMRVLKLVWDVVSIFFQFFGGLLSKVVAFFV